MIKNFFKIFNKTILNKLFKLILIKKNNKILIFNNNKKKINN